MTPSEGREGRLRSALLAAMPPDGRWVTFQELGPVSIAYSTRDVDAALRALAAERLIALDEGPPAFLYRRDVTGRRDRGFLGDHCIRRVRRRTTRWLAGSGSANAAT